MDQQKKHRRVLSFSDVKQEILEEHTKDRNRKKSESFRQEGSIMKDYNNKESEFAASIAAAAFAIYSLEETRAEFERKMVESFREDPTVKNNGSFRKENNKDGSSLERTNLGSLIRRSSDVGGHGSNRFTTRNSTRVVEVSGVEQRGGRNGASKADAWEQARLAKINKWYEKMKCNIMEWENNKKKKASVEMERRKAELEKAKKLNLLHYQNKINRIEEIAEGARKQLKVKKKREEAYAKQQAKKINSTGKLPVQCLCFEC